MIPVGQTHFELAYKHSTPTSTSLFGTGTSVHPASQLRNLHRSLDTLSPCPLLCCDGISLLYSPQLPSRQSSGGIKSTSLLSPEADRLSQTAVNTLALLLSPRVPKSHSFTPPFHSPAALSGCPVQASDCGTPVLGISL